MSWKFVMRTENATDIDEVDNLARLAGYEFFTWNGDVYFVHGNGRTKTSIIVKDLY